MPFSGTFQSLNKNYTFELNNVLNSISYGDNVNYRVPGVFEPTNIFAILHHSNFNRFFIFERRGANDVYGINYTGTQYKLTSSTTTSLNNEKDMVRRVEGASYSPDGKELYVTGDLINVSAGITNITRYDIKYIWAVDNVITQDGQFWFSQSPFNNPTTYDDGLPAICVYEDQNDSNNKKCMCIAGNGQCVTIKLNSTGAVPNHQSRNLSSALGINNVVGVQILYEGLRCLILTSSGVLYELDYQTDDINSSNAYKLNSLRNVQSVNLKTLSGGALQNPQGFWCDRDDPYTSGIWVCDQTNYLVHQFNVNGNKYSPV